MVGKVVDQVHRFLKGPHHGGGGTSNVVHSLIRLSLCSVFSQGAGRICPSGWLFLLLNCSYFESDSCYLVPDDLSYLMCELPQASQPWKTASTQLLRPKAELWECLQSNEDSWQWAASILLQVAALLPYSLSTCSHCKGPFQTCGSGIGQHSGELPWLYCSSPHWGIEQVRPLKQLKRDSPIPKWLTFENIGLSHSPWYLIESVFANSIQISAVALALSSPADWQSKRQQEAVQAICPRTRHLVCASGWDFLEAIWLPTQQSCDKLDAVKCWGV